MTELSTRCLLQKSSIKWVYPCAIRYCFYFLMNLFGRVHFRLCWPVKNIRMVFLLYFTGQPIHNNKPSATRWFMHTTKGCVWFIDECGCDGTPIRRCMRTCVRVCICVGGRVGVNIRVMSHGHRIRCRNRSCHADTQCSGAGDALMRHPIPYDWPHCNPPDVMLHISFVNGTSLMAAELHL